MYNPGLSINHYGVIFIFWNLFLALLPCVIVYELADFLGGKAWKKLAWVTRGIAVVAFIVWFFFLPNTAYLFTMVRHLLDICTNSDWNHVCPAESWMVMFFFVYALTGLPTFLFALSRMARLLGTLFNRKVEVIFPVVMVPVTALGMLIGLVQRRNSWEIAEHPMSLVRTGFSYFTEPSQILNLIVFTAGLYVIYYGFKFLSKKIWS